jgi:hypothetical protein
MRSPRRRNSGAWRGTTAIIVTHCCNPVAEGRRAWSCVQRAAHPAGHVRRQTSRPSYDGKEAAALRPGLQPPPRKAEVDGCTQPILIYSALWPPHRPPMHIPAGSRGPGRGRVGVGGRGTDSRTQTGASMATAFCTRLITVTATIVTHCLQLNDKKNAARSATISAKPFPIARDPHGLSRILECP